MGFRLPSLFPLADKRERCPGKWVPSCQCCQNTLYLDEKEYRKFVKTYEKSLLALFSSFDPTFHNEKIEYSMIEFFERLSAITHIDFPLCSSCLERVKNERIRGLSKDKRVGYVLERLIGAMTIQQKMDSLKEEKEFSTQDEEEPQQDEFTSKSVEELQHEKDSLLESIQSLRISLATAERHKLELDEVQSELATLHDSMNCVASEIALDLGMYETKYNTEKETVEDHKQQLEILMRCNALNDLFNVWFDGNYITVNGMRIGRIGNQVDWVALNGVLGDLAHAVDAMYTLYRCYYRNVVINPLGSFSEVIDRASRTSFKLYFNPKTGNRKLFSQALQLFLEAVNELAKHCSEKFGLALRYSIDQDSSLVGGEDFLCNDLDSWLRALQYLAIDIKQMIVYSYTASICIVRHAFFVCLKIHFLNHFWFWF